MFDLDAIGNSFSCSDLDSDGVIVSTSVFQPSTGKGRQSLNNLIGIVNSV